MKTTVLLVYGFSCSGKTTFCRYVETKYHAMHWHARCMFGELNGGAYTEEAENAFWKLFHEHGNTYWLNFLHGREPVPAGTLLVIESFVVLEEADWIASFFGNSANIHIIFIDAPGMEERVQRKMARNGITAKEARTILEDSDAHMRKRGLPLVREMAEIILPNISSRNDYEKSIDDLVMSFCNIKNIGDN
jgi:dephospho-CoA kinase